MYENNEKMSRENLMKKNSWFYRIVNIEGEGIITTESRWTYQVDADLEKIIKEKLAEGKGVFAKFDFYDPARDIVYLDPRLRELKIEQ